MSYLSRGLRLVPALWLTAAAPSFAEETAQPIIVTGRLSPSLTVELPADAQRSLDRIAGGASLVELANREGRRTATLSDLLRLAPGIFAEPRFGPEDLRLSVRGSGLVRTGHGKGLLVVRDGVPVNAADGNFDPPVLDLGAASHLVVLRGPAAAMLGATTLGGVLALESHTGRTAPGIVISAEGGSFESWRAGARAGLAGGRIDGHVAFAASGSAGWRQQSATRATRLSANVGVELAPSLETRLFVGHADVDAEWPGVLSRAELEANPRQASLVALRREQDNNIRQTHLASRTVHAVGRHRTTLALGYDRRFKDHATPGGILEETNDSWSASLVHGLGDPPAGDAFGLTLGVRGMITDQEALTFGYAGGLLSPNASLKGALVAARGRRARSLEGFGRAEIALGRGLALAPGLAAVWTDRRDGPIAGDPPTGAPAYRRDYHALLPSAGLLFRPRPELTLFAGWAQSFEAPSFFDLGGNVPLQPDRLPRLAAQRADTWEAGARGGLGPLRFEATLYHSRIQGELLRLDAAGALNPPIVNASPTLRTGAEMLARLDLGQWAGGASGRWTLAAKWDWLDARFDDNPIHGRNRIPGIPEHSGFVEAALQPFEGLVLRPNVLLRSATAADLAATPGARAEGFAILGLSASFGRGPWSVWVDARNLADRRYVSAVNIVNRATPGAALFFPGEGRAVYAGIRLAR